MLPGVHASYFGAGVVIWELTLKIRTRVVVLLTGVFLLFALIEWGVGEMLLLPRFEQIENDNALTAMKRIDAGVSQALDGLQVSATDWGNWADTYRFMQDHNKDFRQENLNPIAMKQLHISALAFIDLDGKIIWSLSQDPVTSNPLPLDLFAVDSLPADFPWTENLRDATPRHSLIATNHGVLLAAVAPILDGYGHGPSRGLVVMGRLLTPAEVRMIGHMTREATQDDPGVDPHLMNPDGSRLSRPSVEIGDERQGGRDVEGFADSHQGPSGHKARVRGHEAGGPGDRRPEEQARDDHEATAEPVGDVAADRAEERIDPLERAQHEAPVFPGRDVG